MTAAQRLRLVLALGVVNLVLATVALAVGMSGMSTAPATAGGSTPGTAVASPLPKEPSKGPTDARAAPSIGQPSQTVSPGSSAEPTIAPSASPTILPTPSVAPTPVASVEPTLTPTTTGPTTAAVAPVRRPVVVIVVPAKPMPTPTPTKDAARDLGKPGGHAHESHKPDKSHKPALPSKHHDKRHRHDGNHGQQAIDRARPGPKAGHRLRAGRRAR